MNLKALRRDRQRDDLLTSAGWAVLRFGPRELGSQLVLCVRLIRAAMRARGGLVRAPLS